MGCDIHTYVEKKIDGQWHEVIGKHSYSKAMTMEGFIYSGRNYQLFSLLADVRGGLHPISEPRGQLDDVSEGIQKAYDNWDGDGHSHSYYYLNELLAVNPKRFKDAHAEEFIAQVIPRLQAIAGNDPDSVRFIFWFDN